MSRAYNRRVLYAANNEDGYEYEPAPQRVAGTFAGLGLLDAFKRYRTSVAPTGIISQLLKYLFFISLAAFVLFLILLFVHYTMYPIFSLSPNEPGIISIPTISDEQKFFNDAIVTSADPIPMKQLTDANYTVSFDLYLDRNHMPIDTARILLYRAPQRVTTTAFATADASNLNTYLERVLPSSNFVLYLDPVTNDLHFKAMAVPAVSGARTYTTTDHPIENLSIGNTSRITMVFTEKFVELYVNGKLKTTMPYNGNLVTDIGKTEMFGPLVSDGQTRNFFMSNVSFWPRILTAREVGAYSSGPKMSAVDFQKIVPKTL
jgi:hypothetical protein